jgi:hypothetical protein
VDYKKGRMYIVQQGLSSGMVPLVVGRPGARELFLRHLCVGVALVRVALRERSVLVENAAAWKVTRGAE